MHTSSLYLHLILLAATAATAEPAHPARQISVSGSAIFGRAVCNFGTECGTGCTEDNGSCCDNSAGIACPAGSSCTTINGQVGCCPEGKNCTWVRGCMDFNDGCQGNTCCPSTAPICDTQKKICVASSSASSSANSASTTAAPSPSETAAGSDNLNGGVTAFARPSSSAGDETSNVILNPSASFKVKPTAAVMPPYAKGNSSLLPPEFSNSTGYGNMTMFEGAAVGSRSVARSCAILALLWPLAVGFSML